jgi:phosphoglycolate phosphatase-like HAD superfamily hydrolase
MLNTHKEIIIFDFDGVIVESNKIKYDAFFEIWNGEVSNNLVQNSLLLGGDRNKVINRIYEESEVFKNSDFKPESFVNLYSKIVHKEIFKIGVSKNVISFLKKTNKALFINSATPQKDLIILCKDLKIDKYFVDIFGSPNSKKHNFNIIIKNNNIKVDQILFVGDMQSDKDIADEMDIEFYPVLSKGTDLK